jgi:hypothetical protein
MSQYRVSAFIALGLSLQLPNALGKTVNNTIDCSNIPHNWQPAISFYKTDEKGGSGVYFFEVSTDANKGISRLEKVHVTYDVKGPKGECQYKQEHEIDALKELRGQKYVVLENEGRRVITLSSDDMTDQGGTIDMIVLKEANVIGKDDYASKPMTFKIEIDSRGVVVATRMGKEFNAIAITQKWKDIFTKGNIPVGISRMKFFRFDKELPDTEFVP